MGILPSNISQRKRKKKEEKEENAISIKFWSLILDRHKEVLKMAKLFKIILKIAV